jgi:hypothetical protein
MKKERRIGNRKALNGLLPGRLRTLLGTDLVCKPVDVSPNGLGVLMSKEFELGTVMNLVMKDQVIELEVKWIQSDFHKEELFRYGLITPDVEINLEQIFLDAGCLR